MSDLTCVYEATGPSVNLTASCTMTVTDEKMAVVIEDNQAGERLRIRCF